MPRGGHNKLSDEAKALRGTLVPCRINTNAPTGVRGVGEPSKALTPEARREYRKLSSLLNDMGVLSLSDQGELESLSIVRLQVLHLQKKLSEAKNDPRAYRRIQIALNDSIRLASSLSSKFGLSPADRSRVSVLPSSPTKANKWAKDFAWENYKNDKVER